MRPSVTRSRLVVAVLGIAAFAAVAAACAPMTPPGTTTTTTAPTTTSSTTTTTEPTTTTTVPETTTTTSTTTTTVPETTTTTSTTTTTVPETTTTTVPTTTTSTTTTTVPTTTTSTTTTVPTTTTSTTTTTVPTTTTSTTTTTTVPVTPTVTLAENPVRGVALNGQKAVTVSWTGQAANKLIYVDVCRKSTTDATFEPGVDCAPLSSLTPNGNPSGSGSVAVDVFRGPDPSGDQPWGCFAPGDTAPAGIQRNTTCYVRVTNDSLFNNSGAGQVAFTLFPTGDAVLAENPVVGVALNGTKSVAVFWNNQAANKLIYVDICNKPTSTPGFEPGQDCAPLSSLTPNGSANGSGTINVDIFRGAEPSGDLPWGCFKSSDTAPAGVTKVTTCYVRVTNDTLFNNSAAKEIAFTLG